jgi:hypothetical protein
MGSSSSEEIDKRLSTEAPNEEVLRLLRLCLGRVLEKIDGRGGDWRAACLPDDLRHICDWLAAAVIDKSAWLSRLDAAGRPKKLMKFSTVAGIVAEADKAMLVFAQKHGNLKLTEGEEAVWLDLENGYVLVRLLTAKALDRESSVMQHCIGGGGYDHYLVNGQRLLLSLRDAYGKAHATIEVDTADGIIRQLQGKQNRQPDRRYLSAMARAFSRPDFNPASVMDRLGFVISPDGRFHEKYAIPVGTVVAGDLKYPAGKYPEGFVLPDGLTVYGSLSLMEYNQSVLPAGLVVHGALNLLQCETRRLPSDMVVHGMIHIDGGRLESIPDGFHARSDLSICRASFHEFPEDLTVDGFLSVSASNFPHVPASLRVRKTIGFYGCQIDRFEAVSAVGDLTFADCRIGSLSEGMTVGGNLSFPDTYVGTMPKTADVAGSLVMTGATISEIPAQWKIGGAISANGSTLVSLRGRQSVSGDLLVAGTHVEDLDDLRSVAGNLIVSHRITRLPDALDIAGDLDASGSMLSELPADIKVGGRLLLLNSNVASLPTGLSVGGACDLSGTNITELPEAFSCGSYLDIIDTGIRVIPNGVRARQLMCDDLIEEIGDDVEFSNGVLLPAVPAVLTVDGMRARIATMRDAA